MKAKLKNANGPVRFLLNHGEKLGIAAVLAVAGLLIYSSLGREKLDETKQAEPLKQLTDATREKVQNMTWDNIPEQERTDLTKFIVASGERNITPVNPKDFPEISPPNPPVIEAMKLRSDPVLLAPTELEAHGDAGLWMAADPKVIRDKMIEERVKAARREQEQKEEAERMAEEGERGGERGRGRRGRGPEGREDRGYMGGDLGFSGMKTRDGAIVVPPQGGSPMQGFEDIRERHWVTVLAKVPIEAQFEMYEDALAGAAGFNAQNDQPKYLGYFVQRAEVTSKGQGPWETKPEKGVDSKGLVNVMTFWPIQTPELVTPKYVHPLLTFPLPPMVMREWNDDITHSDMPLQTPEEQAEEMMREAEEAQKQPEQQQGNPDEPFADVYEQLTQPSDMAGGYGGERGYMGRPGGFGGESGRMMGPMGGRGYGGEGGGFGRGGMALGMGSDLQSLPDKQWDGKTKHYLFRYFDSTVEPGRRYRYRVRLVFLDVNARQIPRYVAPEVTARLEEEKKLNVKRNRPANPNGIRLTDWSEPSSIAVVPESGRAFLAAVEPPSGGSVTAEPEARVVVKALNSEFAAEAALSDSFKRGSVLNRSEKGQVIWSSLIKQDPTEDPIDSPLFNFITGLTLVDFDGGEQISKNRGLTAPGRALVMDAAGRVRLKGELDDQKSVRPFDLIIQASEEAARRARSNNNNERGGPRGGRGS